jgi:hypothetical protein
MAPPTLAQSAISSNPEVVIGVDTHKDIHVAVALALKGGRLGECRIPITRNGYDELIGWTEQFVYSPLFAMEGTWGCPGSMDRSNAACLTENEHHDPTTPPFYASAKGRGHCSLPKRGTNHFRSIQTPWNSRQMLGPLDSANRD